MTDKQLWLADTIAWLPRTQNYSLREVISKIILSKSVLVYHTLGNTMLYFFFLKRSRDLVTKLHCYASAVTEKLSLWNVIYGRH